MNSKFNLAFLFSFFQLVFSFAQTTVTVDEVVQIALQKNFDIQVVRATSATQFTDKRFIYGAFLPAFNLNGGYQENYNLNVKNVTFAGVEKVTEGVRSSNLNGSVQMVWTLFDGTRMFATRQRLLQLAELGEVTIRNQIVNSVAATMTNFYSIVRQQEQLKAINEIMAVSLERVKLAERKLEVGTGAKPELLQAKVDLNAQRTLAVQQEILIQQIKDQMNGQLGFGLPERFEIADTIPIDLNLREEEIIAAIENSNQAVQVAKKNVEVATTAIWEAKASRFPTIQAVGALNYNKSTNYVAFSPTAQQLTRSYGFNSYGLTISMPLLNNMNINRNIAQARVTQSRMQAIYDQQKALATVGVLNAYTNYDNSKKILLIQEENILVAKENVEIALAGFKRGVTTFIELRTAQQSLSDAYNQLIAARFSTKAAEIELMRLSGALLK